MDLFYFPDSLAANVSALSSPDDSACPYNGLSAPQGKPGSIVVLGYTDSSGTGSRVTEYGIVGFGEDTAHPMREPASPDNRYFLLTNYPPETE